MSRQANRARLGFFPIHPDVMALIAPLLRPREGVPPEERFLLDPCCGEGLAAAQLADAIGVPLANVHAVELDERRSAAAAANLPGAELLPRCSFHASRVTAGSMSVAYCNPPFDAELGGGRREEAAFAARSTSALAAGGILVLIAPASAFASPSLCQHIDAHYDEVRTFRFPGPLRKFREFALVGRKRRHPIAVVGRHGPLEGRRYYLDADSPELAPGMADRWEFPAGFRPRRFEKTDVTEEELVEALNRSPLRGAFDPPPAPEVERPGLTVNDGQTILTLVSGYLDGPVRKGDEPVHVIRGTSTKVEFVKEDVPIVGADGAVSGHKRVIAQEPKLTIRALDGTFDRIFDFSSATPADKEGDDAA